MLGALIAGITAGQTTDPILIIPTRAEDLATQFSASALLEECGFLTE